MTVDAAILRCPITGGALDFVKDDRLPQMCVDIAAKLLTHLDGSPVGDVFDGFLQTADGRISYPMPGGVLILLSDFAILTEGDRQAHAACLTASSTRAVMDFYDEIGWKKTASGAFHDADINEDFRAGSRRYIRDCHLRVNVHLPPRGRYILDIASGPIQYDEYLTYSENFDRRICCDVSFVALRAAAGRIGAKGIFIQCDITNIPLRDEAVDAFVCLHTIYHVPAERQLAAFRELERVTRRGGSGVVVYAWDNDLWGANLTSPWRAITMMLRRLHSALRPFVPDALLRWRQRNTGQSVQGGVAPAAAIQSASQHCYYAHSYRWYEDNVAASGRWSLHSWRSVGLTTLKRRIPNNAFGEVLLAVLYRLESQFPRILGRFGAFPMIVLRRP